MNLGENIYKYRTQKNMSQGDLADALNVSRQSVSKWENNNAVPELEKLIKMSQLFDISLDVLVGRAYSAPVSEPSPMQPFPEEKSPKITVQKLLGIILLCIGLVFALLSLSATELSVLVSQLVLGTVFALWGIICIKIKHHAGFLCLYILYLLTWVPMGVLAPNYIRLGFAKIMQLTHILWGTALACYGLRIKKRGTFLNSNHKSFLFFLLLDVSILISFLILLFPGLLPTPGLLRS